MTKRKSSGGVLIVVELGAEWPSLAELREPASGRRVLAQEEGESPSGFVARVGEQLDGLFARGAPMTTAVVACNERLDESAKRARSELARTAMGLMAKERSGSLLLSASSRSSGRLRHALSSLASELGGEWQRAAVLATVRFGDEPMTATSSDMSVSVRAGRGKDGSRKVA
jgi:hypothetical protein